MHVRGTKDLSLHISRQESDQALFELLMSNLDNLFATIAYSDIQTPDGIVIYW
ncbi:hypothetical protein B0O80DRAFT_460414 [Mortierella sp. GBAus27b]|nr:hypothetical protein B0O80DRAFT_460414 [Mortierella sp. GBAus27b]